MTERSTILIVDDDDIFLTILESMIQSIGHPVLKAHNGIEALTLFGEHQDKIGCVVLDIQMPKMNGIITLERLKQVNNDLKVIIVSGVLNGTNRALLSPLKPAGYLDKPVTFEDLSTLLLQCLE